MVHRGWAQHAAINYQFVKRVRWCFALCRLVVGEPQDISTGCTLLSAAGPAGRGSGALQVLAHADLAHELVLVAVHAGQLPDVREGVLQPVRQLERVHVAQAELPPGTQDVAACCRTACCSTDDMIPEQRASAHRRQQGTRVVVRRIT